MAGVSAGGGDVYGKDVITSGKENSGTLTLSFSRQYRNRIVQNSNYNNAKVPAFGRSQSNRGWYVLPIQNSWTAALKPRDLAAMDNLFKSYHVDSIGIQLSQMNIVETNATVNQLQDTTIPNLVMEMYVDNDHDLPGYNEDFLTVYGTNNGYTTADIAGDSLQAADIDLKIYEWSNTNAYGFNPAIELNLLGNGPGFKMMTQNEDFSFDWKIKNGKKRHTFVPWQYQQNPEYRRLINNVGYPTMENPPNEARLLSNYTSSSGGWYSPNAAAGSFPGGSDGVRTNASGQINAGQVEIIKDNGIVLPDNISGVNVQGNDGSSSQNSTTVLGWKDPTTGEIKEEFIQSGTIYAINHPVDVQTDIGGKVVTDVELNLGTDVAYVSTGAGEPAEYGVMPEHGWGPAGDYIPGDQNCYVSYYNQANRDQITGLPFIGDIPPYILCRPQIRTTAGISTIEFIVKYTITITGERNVLGFYPMPVDPDENIISTWCGTGNLGFQTRPGVNRYRLNQSAASADFAPINAPYLARSQNVPAEFQNPAGTAWISKGKRPSNTVVHERKPKNPRVEKLKKTPDSPLMQPLLPVKKVSGCLKTTPPLTTAASSTKFVGIYPYDIEKGAMDNKDRRRQRGESGGHYAMRMLKHHPPCQSCKAKVSGECIQCNEWNEHCEKKQ